MTIAPSTHQVCSSVFVSKAWISAYTLTDISFWIDDLSPWQGLKRIHLELLSTLCELANKTISEAISHFGIQSLLTSNVLTEDEFYTRMNTTFSAFTESLITDFRLLTDTHITPAWDPPLAEIHPLVYKQETSQYPPNTSISTIIKNMMIEQWNPLSSYDHYYQACAPMYCTYSDITRTNRFIEVVIKLVSLIGGLTIVLRFITVQLVRCVFRIIRPTIKNQQQDNVAVLDRVRQVLKKMITLLRTTLINLNIFPIRTFGSNTDRMQAKYLGILSTRLYIVLVIIGFTILSLYIIIQPETLTTNIAKPSLTVYKSLLLEHHDTLRCPCSTISSAYDRFMNIEPIFHQICSSPFVTNEWQTNITAGLTGDLSNYAIRDYRRFFSAHLKLLSGLCEFSHRSVNDSIRQLLSSLFITDQLRNEIDFHLEIDSFIERKKVNMPIKFTHLLSLLRRINHGNAIITAYGTNFQYINPPSKPITSVVITQPVTYEDGCSCALTANCTMQASFIQTDTSELISIQGLKMGCTPTESFLYSTLECFYDLSCIHLIEHFTNNIITNNYITNVSLIFSTNTSRFSVNTKVIDLVEDLFIEDWSITIDYSAYFHQCSPNLCSYTYVQKFNSLYTITTLLGLYGGLTFVLKWICPNLVHLIMKLYHYRIQRKNRVKPVCAIEMITTDRNNTSTVPKNNHHTTMDGTALPIISTATYTLSTYSTAVTTAIMPITTATSSSSTEVMCQLTFQLIHFDNTSTYRQATLAVDDLNNDGHLDIVALENTENVEVFLGKGDGTFALQESFPLYGFNSYAVSVADINTDGHKDLLLVCYDYNIIYVLSGDGNGDFNAVTLHSGGFGSALVSTAVGDFNNDDLLDIALLKSNPYAITILYNSNGSIFQEQMTICTTPCIGLSSIAVDDVDEDNDVDIIVSSASSLHDDVEDYVYVLLNNGSGYFDKQLVFSTGRFSRPTSVVVADFNHDDHLDLVVANSHKHNIGIMLGNSDGTFQTQMTFPISTYSYPGSVTTGDFNNDNHLDIAVSNSDAHNIGILLGNGNGTFLAQRTFSTGSLSEPWLVVSGDFNSDGKVDLVFTDITGSIIRILMNTCDCCML
ncbi:unnamed protein product [Adineta steineri]|uniref:Uncharacterized protein n=1 Tax=Adineta steineri TaxID=433720 RepID=A0A815MTL8_9BILA|nr:unnamed protein product [Adineta steineri]CAF3844451.1 unnamed protein product [Adineta steineri]